MANAEELRRRVDGAKERLSKIGRREPHLQEGVGTLSALTLHTTVCHQAAPSAKNYWDDECFDFALAKVIRSKFGSLADEAIALMEKDATDALLAEEQQLRSRLAEIERIKSSQS